MFYRIFRNVLLKTSAVPIGHVIDYQISNIYGKFQEKLCLQERIIAPSRGFSRRSVKNPYPPLQDDEIEEKFTRGSGPGGQNVNKLANCVLLRHIPSGIFVKCHEDRSLAKNRETARLRLQEKLDWHFNGENSLKEREKRAESKRKAIKKKRTNEKLEKLRAFKEREGID